MTSTRTERMVDVPGGRVWTCTHRPDDEASSATPLLVLHGGPGMPSHYLEPLAALADTRPVVFYDQLGCGRSERPEDPSLWTVERAVAEVEAVRRELGLDRVHLLGHSWGAFLALSHAVAHAPVRPGEGVVSSLVLSSPLVSVAGWVEDATALVARLPEELQATIARHERDETYDDPAYVAATDAFYRRFLCTLDPWPPELVTTFEQLGAEVYRTMWGPSEFTQTGTLRGSDLAPELPGLGVPSLWVAGTEDEVAPARLTWFAGEAGGRAELVQGGSHCLHLEQPSRYLTLVDGFLRGTETV